MMPPVPTMTPVEFVERAELMFGKKWRKPVARVVDRSPRMVTLYATGNPIPPGIAEKLRRASELGETGTIILDAIRQLAPEFPPYDAFVLAKGILGAMTDSGIFGSNQKQTQRRIDWNRLRRIMRS